MIVDTSVTPPISSLDLDLRETDLVRYIREGSVKGRSIYRVRVPDGKRKRSFTVRVDSHPSKVEAMRHAINYRDWVLCEIVGNDPQKFLEAISPAARPVQVIQSHSKNTTGKVGVRFIPEKHVFQAHWIVRVDGQAKPKMRQFSIERFGVKRAWALACVQRDEGIGVEPAVSEDAYFADLSPEIKDLYS